MSFNREQYDIDRATWWVTLLVVIAITIMIAYLAGVKALVVGILWLLVVIVIRPRWKDYYE